MTLMNSNEIYLNGDKWNITEALEKSYVAYIIITHQSKNTNILSTSIYDLVLIYVCHFHQVLLLLQSLFKFDHYWDTRAFILDPCIQGIFHLLSFLVLSAEVLSEVFYFQLKNKPLFQSDIKLHLFTNSKFKPLRYFCDFFVLSSLLKLVNKSS